METEEKANVVIIICCPLLTSGLATLSNVFFNTSYCIAQGKVCPSVGRLYQILTMGPSLKQDQDRKEGKGRRCWLVYVLDCRTISSKDDLNQSFWENIHFGGVVVWYGVNQMVIPLSKHPFRQVVDILLILYFKLSWWKIVSATRNLIISVPQTAVIFAFSSLSFLHGVQ